MLEFLRAKKDSVILKGFLGLLALSFGIWGVGDFIGTSKLSPGVALKAGRAELKTQSVQRRFVRELERFREAMGGQAVDDAVIKRSVMASMMDDMTRATIVDAAALDLGITVSRDQIREMIMKNESFQQNGKFSQMRFDEALNQNQLTEAAYVELMQISLRNAEVMLPVAVNAYAPDTLIDALFAYRSETRVADTLLIPAATMTLQKTPTDDELKAVYDKNIAAFTAPEFRKLTILTLGATDLVKPESIDDAEVKTYYEQNTARYQTPESRHIVQLIFETKEKAEAARAQAATGDTLETVAKKANANDVVDLGNLTADSPLAKMIGAAFTAPSNEISQPIQSDLGWHLFETKSVTPQTVKTFDEAKEEIRKAIAADKGADAVYDASTHMEDALASGTPVAEVAKMIGARLDEVGPIDQGGKNTAGFPLPNLFDPKNFLPTAFTTPAGKDSKLMDLPTHDGYYVIHVDEVTPPTPKPLIDVRAQAVALWEADARTAQAQAVADKLVTDATSSTPLSSLEAKDKRLSYAPLGPVTRLGEGAERQHVIDGARVSPQMLDKLFAAKVDDVFTAPVATGIIVARLKDIVPPKPVGDLARAREELAAATRNEVASNLADQLGRAFTIRYPVDVDQKAIDDIAGAR